MLRSIVVAVGAALVLTSFTGTGEVAVAAAASASSQVTQTGYTKAYRYDSRLLADKPPYFPDDRVTSYLFFTNFESLDPGLGEEPAGCVGRYYSEWVGRYSCQSVTFVSGDKVEGPFHTNDAASVEGDAEFGRAGADPPDVVEIVGGTHPEDGDGQCTGMPIFHTATHCYARGERIPLPEGVTDLAASAEGEDSFSGETRLELDGSTSSISVVDFEADGEQHERTIPWPRNGLLYVGARSCAWPTAATNLLLDTDGAEEAHDETGCGNVYVRGSYSQPLTIVAQEDLIIDGSVYPTSVAGRLGASVSGEATLGLVAGDYVRVYHPVRAGAGAPGCGGGNLTASEDPNGWGSQPGIWIYAAILAVRHSFFVDNPTCGSGLGDLNVYGSIAQNYRGVVGAIFGGGGTTSTPPPAPCTSRRRFLVHIVQIRGLRYRRIDVSLNGHRVRARMTKRGVVVEVDLRGRPKGTYVLRIVVETTRRRTIAASRTYHTCAAVPLRPRRRSTL